MTPTTPDLTRRRLLGLGLLGAGAIVLEGLPGAERALAAATGPRAVSAAVGVGSGRRHGPIVVPGGFDLAGLRWDGDPRARIELRARRRGGRWSEWLPVHVAHDHGPDGAAPAPGTDPVWTGRADEVELRLDRSLRGLTLHTVRADGARRRIVVARAAQAPAPPPIITRAQWGGDTLRTRGAPELGTVQMAFVHHTVNANSYTAEESPAIVLAIAKYHIRSNGWNDIGYNFLVDRYGQIFEGRAGGIDQPVIGAQAQGYNAVSTGISNIGTFESTGQTEAALNAMAQLIAWKLAIHGVSPEGTVEVVSAGGSANRYPSGRRVTFQRISGHRDGDKTSCPGAALYAQLPEIRRRAAAQDYPIQSPDVPVAGSGQAQLSIQPAATQVAAYSTVHVLGQLRDVDGGPIAGVEVRIQKRGATRWSTAARARTDRDGRFDAPVVVRQSTRLRAWFGGDADVGGEVLTSPEVAVNAIPKLTIDVSAKRVPVGGTVQVRVAARPTRSRVDLVVTRRGPDGRYRTVSRHRLRRSGSALAADVRLTKAGLYGFTVSAPADGKGVAVSGPRVHVRCARGLRPSDPIRVEAGGVPESNGGGAAVASG
ncbi:MAG: N-acetylmuramoyl-L-alanine amidase [Solirubrobacteraceae bacterium]|nr:N-acetylmuramoyl-L-alanine amidase [Solirubrobacteraceae bacterium]